MHGVWPRAPVGIPAISCSEHPPSEEERAEGGAEVSPEERENIFLPRSTLGQLLSVWAGRVRRVRERVCPRRSEGGVPSEGGKSEGEGVPKEE